MIQAAPHAMSASQGRDYYDKEYSSGDYYTKDANDVPGEWSGKGAEELGLKGEIKKDDFTAVLEGRSGADGKQIIPDPPTGEHRAGWDFTCSPDKSISVMALVGGDKGIIEDVKAANAKAMQELERFAMAKDKDRAFETTGNLTVASFVHETSRKLDPQLHVHNVVMNMTQRGDGKMVALETRELYAAQSYATAVFRAELAERLQVRGYEVEIGKDGNVSIKDVPRDLCDEFSKRRREDIEPYLEKHGKSGADAAQQAAHSTRRAKQHNIDESILKESWRDVAKEKGVDLNQIRARAEDRALLNGTQPNQEKTAIEPSRSEHAKASLHHAMEHLSEIKATFQGRELYTEALKHGMGKVTLEDIRSAAKAEKDLIRVQERDVPSGRMTTTVALKFEQRNVNLMREGIGKGESVLSGKIFEANKPLSDGQRAVATHILTSKDQIIAVEGKAGAGKTYTLEAVVSAAKAEGWNVRGFAPTTSAAKTLGEAGLDTKTIAALGQEKPAGSQGRQLWIVDEAGLMSSKAAVTVLEKAKEAGAKVVFVGDRLQHSAVEAGKPFAYLQGAGLQAVRLDEIQRQARPAEAIHRATEAAQQGRWQDACRVLEGRKGKPIPELEKAAQAIKEGRHGEALEILEARAAQARALEISVKDASEGRTAEAVAGLEKAGKVVEIQDKAERHKAVAQDYLSTPQGQTCIVIAPSNAERRDLNRLIREELIQTGAVEKQSVKAEIRTNAGLTEAQKKDARSYEAGEYLKFRNTSKVYGIEKGDEGRVVSVDKERNLVRVELQNGKTVDFNPSRFQAESYTLDSRRFAVGDRIQYREATKPDGAKIQGEGFRIVNGDTGTIQSIDRETGKAVVTMDSGKKAVELDLLKPQPIDHAYAVTSHASQGMTIDRSLAVIDTTHSRELVNREQFYVSESRAALECRVYTDSKADLTKAVSRETGKSSALEMVQGKDKKEVRNAAGFESRREHGGERTAAEPQRGNDRRSPERGERTTGEASKSPSTRGGNSWNFDGGPAAQARNDLSPRSAASERHGSSDRPAQQHADSHKEIPGTSRTGGSREAEAGRGVHEELRGAQTGHGRVIEGEAGAGRPTPEAQHRLDRSEGRGHEADRNGASELGTSAGGIESSNRDNERDGQDLREADRRITEDRGAEANRDRGNASQSVEPVREQLSTRDEAREVGALADRDTSCPRPDSPSGFEVTEHSAPEGGKEIPAWAAEANVRAEALEGKLKEAEGELAAFKGEWQDRQSMAEKVEDLAAQVYEAKQETRTDINQDRIKDLKDEFKSLEAESRKAESWSERAPILDRQKEIQGEIYEQRHGQRTELGDQSAKHRLGHEEHKLHEAHRAISEFGKQHPETGIESPATRAGVQGMNQAQLKDLSKNLQQAASHLQTASRSMDRMKDGNVGAELRGQLKSAAEQAIAKAAPALAAASKAVEAAQHRGLSMGR